MIFHKFIFPMVIILSTFALPAASESIQELLLLQSEIDTQIIQNREENKNKDSGVPTSDTFIIPNAENAASNAESILQSVSPNTHDESVIQRYYKILTGETLPVYGVSEFQQKQDSSLLFFNTMGKDYRLAAGDVLRVTLRGLYENDATYKIGRDGNLILPSLAPLNVSGITISEAERRLLNVLRYDDASAAVYISLETARLVTVQVSGAVKNPRTLAVPAFTPLSRVLAYSGGIKETGSLRDIVLRDRDGSTTRIDFYDFLKSPSGANDPLVTDASRIFVGNQGNTVAAKGFVARPGIYELPSGQDKIRLKELLELTGTRIIPPGLIVEALYFDGNGLSQARKLKLDEKLSVGEVLNLRFLPTKQTSMIQVKGAVLEEYSVTTSKKISISQLLRDGATLAENAFLDFVLVIDEKSGSRAVDLTEVFKGQEEFVDAGSEIHIFTAEELLQLAASPINQNTDKILSALLDAEVAELYVNGSRIAYLPPSKSKSFADIIRPFYRLSPYTSRELTILENNKGDAKATNLGKILKNNSAHPLTGGDKIYLFENSFLELSSKKLNYVFDNKITEDEFGTDQPEIRTRDSEPDLNAKNSITLKTLSKLFARAGILRIRLDGEIISLLPNSSETTVHSIISNLGFELADNLADLAVMNATSGSKKIPTKIINVANNSQQKVGKYNLINFYTPDYLYKIVKSPDTEEFEQLQSLSVNLYQDYNLKGFGSSDSLLKESSYFGRKLSDPNLYPLFAIHEFYNASEGFWQKKATTLSALVTKEFSKEVKAGSRIYTFTHDFIAKALGTSNNPDAGTSSEVLELLRDQVRFEDRAFDDAVKSEDTSNGEVILRASTLRESAENKSATLNIEPHSKFIFSSARFISGAVERPGYFPVSGEVTVSQLLAAAGGLTRDADIENIQVFTQKVSNGNIVSDQKITLNLRDLDANSYVLTGRYSLNVPSLINEVAAAIVTLDGEVQRPGEYLVARDETLHQVIKRAGGLTRVAYPLGAVFTRISIKDKQRVSNALLADQLEQAVLQLSQSDRSGAAEQIEAVLLYAEQLRSQKVTGRLSVNVLLPDPISPVFLEDGDKLTIPKRPSHVSVIGSVRKDTVAKYSNSKTLSDYLANAGGPNKIADLGATYILLPNGESIPADSGVIIPAGAVIVVPPNTDRISPLRLTDIFSRILGNIATSFLAINNVK